MAKDYLEFTQEEIENALAKMPADQRSIVEDLADEDMLQYIPNISEESIPDCVNDIIVDAIVQELEPHIRNAVISCTVGLRQYFEPFKNYRRTLIEARDGGNNEESC